MDSPFLQARALADVAVALASVGDVDRAKAIADSITEPAGQARALAGVAEGLAETGDTDRARHVAQQAETIGGSITDQNQHEWALVEVAAALARAGDVDRVEAIAGSIAEPLEQARALAAVAEMLARIRKTSTKLTTQLTVLAWLREISW